jgi:hypothetical protein
MQAAGIPGSDIAGVFLRPAALRAASTASRDPRQPVRNGNSVDRKTRRRRFDSTAIHRWLAGPAICIVCRSRIEPAPGWQNTVRGCRATAQLAFSSRSSRNRVSAYTAPRPSGNSGKSRGRADSRTSQKTSGDRRPASRERGHQVGAQRHRHIRENRGRTPAARAEPTGPSPTRVRPAPVVDFRGAFQPTHGEGISNRRLSCPGSLQARCQRCRRPAGEPSKAFSRPPARE